jgi:asparagine synthetase B (glutamine-hydrolysing)
MCGIAGEVRFDGADADLAALARCTARMTRCGPDSGGAWTSGPIGFGHRRLKIIDLSAARSQPMIDAQLGLSVVFNGCLYNYRTAARFCPRSRRSSPVTRAPQDRCTSPSMNRCRATWSTSCSPPA